MELDIDHGLIDLHVTFNGEDVFDAPVYLFTESGNYLGRYERTDYYGHVEFLIPAKSYKFRVDYEGTQYWSDVVTIIPHEENNIELNLDQLALNLTNDPDPVRFDGKPPAFKGEEIRLASIGSLIGILSQTVVANTSSPRVYYYLNDHLGTPQVITDEDGEVVWEATYKPFGEVTVDPTSIINNNFRFPGQYYDKETGMHYNYFRYYDPGMGRYLTPDPIGLNGGVNLYLYVDGDPINLIDPMGLIRWREALNSGLGLLSNSLGVVVGSALLAAPEPTLATKVVGGVVLGKSLVGWGLNWYNLTQAFRDDCDTYDAPSSTMRAIATLSAPGNTDVLLAADALDLGIDLMAGRARVYAYGTPTLWGAKGVTRPYDPVNLTFTHPGPVKTFQALETARTVKTDLVLVNGRLEPYLFD